LLCAAALYTRVCRAADRWRRVRLLALRRPAGSAAPRPGAGLLPAPVAPLSRRARGASPALTGADRCRAWLAGVRSTAHRGGTVGHRRTRRVGGPGGAGCAPAGRDRAAHAPVCHRARGRGRGVPRARGISADGTVLWLAACPRSAAVARDLLDRPAQYRA